jgi:formylglycine-generating enzyme required for sulfatase activity
MERTMNETDLFITIPETTLPGGSVVPAFMVGQYACSQGADGKVAVTAEGAPWVRINFEEAKAACEASGYKMITESQWLAIAWNAAQQDCNWTKGKVGDGKLFRGIRKANVSSAQPGTFVPASAKERRWLTLGNGERICDVNGNVFQWVFDDVQGTEAGLTTIIEADSLSLQAPFPPMEKGLGWRPDGKRDWSGIALVRGGYWLSVAYAGVFLLDSGWPDSRSGSVGFRCTKSVSEPGSLVAA